MEVVRCSEHGTICFLKTGVRDGPNKGKSFYVCRTDTCGFVRAADIPVSYCLFHEDFVVELQGLFLPQGKKEYRLFFRCAKSKAEGKRWCGNVPWQDPNSKEHPVTHNSQHASKPVPCPSSQPRNPFKVLNKNQKPAQWKQFVKEKGEEKIADKESREEGNQLLVEKREQKSESNCWVEKDLSSGLVTKKGQSGVEKKQEESTQFQGDAKETGGVASKQRHGNEPRGTSTPQKSDGPSQDIQNRSKPLREKVTQLLPQNIHGQDPVSQSQKAGHLGKEHIKNWKAKEAKAERVPSTQTFQERLPQGHFQAPPETHWPAPTGPVPSGHFLGEGRPLGLGHRASTSSSENEEEEDRTSSEPGSPLLFDLTEDSQKEENLQFPDQSVKRRVSATSGVPKKIEPSELAAQRVHLTTQLKKKKSTLASVNIQALPDKGEKLIRQIQELEEALSALALSPDQAETNENNNTEERQQNNFTKTTSDPPLLVPPQPLPGHDVQPLGSLGLKAACQITAGGPTNQDRLHAVWKITSEAIDELHRSLESRPGETAVAEDPAGLKVPLLLHQKQALAWLLWRESQKPQGGILADDMGLGKTLTMIALILAKKNEEKSKAKDKSVAVTWLSKDDSSDFTSHGTLIVCPASLIHHWKKEVEKHVNSSKLRVYLYHGPNRSRHAKV